MAATCAKCFIVIVNIIFTLLGLTMLAGGIFIKVGDKYYADKLDKFQDEIPDIAGGAGLTVEDEDNKDSTLDLGSILQNMAIVLIVFGLFMTLTGVMGMCGACCAKKWMLVVYIIIVAVIFLAQVAVLIVLITKTFENQIKDEIKDIIKKDYGGIDDFGVKSLSMNYIMLSYECCGLDGYEDFEESENWVNNRTLDIEGITAVFEMITPIACCATTGNFPKIEIINANCAIAPNETISNYEEGCWESITDDVEDRKIIFLAGLGVILAFELFCVILASCILHKESREKNEDFA